MADPNATILDLDSMLDQSMESVESLPDYVTPPPGNYILAIDKAEIVKSTDPKKPSRLVITHKVVSTEQLASGVTEPEVADGSLFSEGFQGTEDGLKFFKRSAKNYMAVTDEAINAASVRDVLATLPSAEPFRAVISHTKSKSDDGTQEYINLRIRVVPPAAE